MRLGTARRHSALDPTQYERARSPILGAVENPSFLNHDPLLNAPSLRFVRDLIGNMRHDLGVNLARARAWLASAPPSRLAVDKAMLLAGCVSPSQD
jgi:hypothetical protein